METNRFDGKKKSVQLNIRVTPPVMDDIKKLSRLTRLSQSDVIESAIRSYMAKVSSDTIAPPPPAAKATGVVGAPAAPPISEAKTDMILTFLEVTQEMLNHMANALDVDSRYQSTRAVPNPAYTGAVEYVESRKIAGRTKRMNR